MILRMKSASTMTPLRTKNVMPQGCAETRCSTLMSLLFRYWGEGQQNELVKMN